MRLPWSAELTNCLLITIISITTLHPLPFQQYRPTPLHRRPPIKGPQSLESQEGPRVVGLLRSPGPRQQHLEVFHHCPVPPLEEWGPSHHPHTTPVREPLCLCMISILSTPHVSCSHLEIETVFCVGCCASFSSSYFNSSLSLPAAGFRVSSVGSKLEMPHQIASFASSLSSGSTTQVSWAAQSVGDKQHVLWKYHKSKYASPIV